MLRRALKYLLVIFVVLNATFLVTITGYTLTDATGDHGAAKVLWWISMICLMTTAINLILLLITLGFNALDDSSEPVDI